MKKKSTLPALFFRALTALYLFGLTFLIAVQNSDSIWGNGETWVDASVYKYVAWMIDLGYMPYKDTFDHKGPLVYLFFLAGRRIASWRGVWVLYFAMLFVSLSVIWLIFRKCCSGAVSALLMLVITAVAFDYAIINMSPESMTIPFMAVGLYIFLDYFLYEKISAWRLLLTGVCFGCVLMIKAQMISVWFVFCIAVLIKNIREKTAQKILFFLAFFLAGTMAVILPVCLWLILGGAWKEFIAQYIVFNMEYARYYSGSTPLESTLAKGRALVFFFNRPVVLLCLFLLAALFYFKKSHRFFYAAYFVYLIMSIAVAAMSGRTYSHYGAAILVAVTWPLALSASFMSAEKPGSRTEGAKKQLQMSGGAFLVLAYLVCIFAAPVIFKKADNAIEILQNYNAGVTSLPSNLKGILDVIAQNTTEDDRITVHGLYDIIYGKSERLSASKYSYQHAFSRVETYRNDEYFAELDANPPKLILQGDPEPERMMEFIVSHGYHWIATSEEGDFKIYKRFDKAELPQEEWIDVLGKTDSLEDYLDLLKKLEEKHDIMVFLAVKGKAGDALTVKNASQLEALGFSSAGILLDDDYHTFLGVSKKNESLYEAVGGNGYDQYQGKIGGVELSLISAVKRRGNEASVKVGGVECALNRRGLNIVVYDPASSTMIDSVVFDVDDEETPCTR